MTTLKEAINKSADIIKAARLIELSEAAKISEKIQVEIDISKKKAIEESDKILQQAIERLNNGVGVVGGGYVLYTSDVNPHEDFADRDILKNLTPFVCRYLMEYLDSENINYTILDDDDLPGYYNLILFIEPYENN